ncbi:hypothetical protein HGO97_016910 [Faecalicatena sp. AGMB00832]|uniref:Uncharacterized protein n=1 Tax=Faecalicatena faecalis TaxID=2726362 RepID=A0ABS6D7I8_9FIRM|nr:MULTISPECIES: hypothetical protein [Faecalicatena]MBU3877486.1 hypothetical protein [Faecalicatena faecalis]MCI6464256.1 hypothetical protein [Faecalicatena sp.]MDY5621223.1 hypothetical protein [Lachnospiraceae bacterium]
MSHVGSCMFRGMIESSVCNGVVRIQALSGQLEADHEGQRMEGLCLSQDVLQAGPEPKTNVSEAFI